MSYVYERVTVCVCLLSTCIYISKAVVRLTKTLHIHKAPGTLLKLTDFEVETPPLGVPLSFEKDAIFLLLCSLIVLLTLDNWGSQRSDKTTHTHTYKKVQVAIVYKISVQEPSEGRGNAFPLFINQCM